MPLGKEGAGVWARLQGTCLSRPAGVGTWGRGEGGQGWLGGPTCKEAEHISRLGMTSKAGGSSPWRTPATPQVMGSSVHCEITRVILNGVSKRNGFEILGKTSSEAETNRKENEM